VNAKYHTGNHTQKWLNKEFSKANADEFMDKVFRTDITRLIVDDPVRYLFVANILIMPNAIGVSHLMQSYNFQVCQLLF
jgi:hypothetical protein